MDASGLSGAFVGRQHHLSVRVYYEDTDFTGLVYHANYSRYFERGRSDFLRLIGVSHSALLEQEEPSAFVVTRMDIRFRKPARIDDHLTVITAYDQIKGPRLLIRQTIVRGDDLIAGAEVEAACISLAGKPRKPSAQLVAALGPWLSPTMV